MPCRFPRCYRHLLTGLALMLFAVPMMASLASAQTDEIQVYDAAIAAKGTFNLMSHSNFTPKGDESPKFPDAIIADHSFQETLEWAYGVKDWFEQGLYLPVTTLHSQGRGSTINGFKVRELFVTPHAEDRTFFYGVNFEFSTNHLWWESKHETAEVRPIVGMHLHPASLAKHQLDLIFNPIVDTDYTGGIANLEFVPSGRIAMHFNNQWALAAEEYSDFGPLHHFLKPNQQFQEVWATTDYYGKVYSIETGIGVGITDGADKLTLKFMIARDFHF
jgi:hypothetical protein